MTEFVAKKSGGLANVPKEFGPDMAKLEAFCSQNSLNIDTVAVQEGGAEPSAELFSEFKVLKGAAKDVERPLDLFHAPAQAMILFRIFNLLREEANKAEPVHPRFQAAGGNNTITKQGCFGTITCYCTDVFISEENAVIELTPRCSASWPRSSNPAARRSQISQTAKTSGTRPVRRSKISRQPGATSTPS